MKRLLLLLLFTSFIGTAYCSCRTGSIWGVTKCTKNVTEQRDSYVGGLPYCKSSNKYWHNCFGTYIFDPLGVLAGDKYVGEFLNNVHHGKGTYTYSDGGLYVGEFKDNTKYGQGTMTYPDGSLYVGEYKYGKYHGQGTYTHADGRIEKGIWQNDKMIDQQIKNKTTSNKTISDFKKDLEAIKDLLDSELITKEDYDKQKQKILDRM